MKNILIIGATGFGRCIYEYIECMARYQKDFIVKGFLDSRTKALDGWSGYPPIISSVENYTLCENDMFVCAVGDFPFRKKYADMIIEKGGEFFTVIHPLASISRDAIIGKGCIIGESCIIASGAVIGDNCIIQALSVIAHDVKIGNWSRVDTHAVLTGGSSLGNNVTIHTGAIINQKIRVEDNACVGAGSFVIRKVKQGATVYGNPAIEL